MRTFPALKISQPTLLLILMVTINLVIAGLIYQDFGLSWDEPLFYQYGEAVGYAYSIPARLSSDFDLEKAYGPSASDHKIYGPAYLLVGQVIRRLLSLFLPETLWSLWRLVNFSFFQAGLIVFYFLMRRWITPWAALAATALMAYQPLLWGMAFLNPKDIPFLVFFIFTIAAGFTLVDEVAVSGENALPEGQTQAIEAVQLRWRKAKILCLISLGVLLAFFVWLYSDANDSTVAKLISYVYSAPSENLLRRVVTLAIPMDRDIPVEVFINKSLDLFFRYQSSLGVLTGLLLSFFLFFLILLSLPQLLTRFDRWFFTHFRLPEWRLPYALGAVRSLGFLIRKAFLPGLLLGALTSIRVIGPLAGIFVLGYFLLKRERRSWWVMIFYGGVAIVTLYATWPYLWEAPIANFLGVFRHMANNPQILPVLFNGQIYPSNQLPWQYLPVLLAISLTEPTLVLAFLGAGISIRAMLRGTVQWRTFLWMLGWFFLPLVYVLWRRPPMYDGFRHFLFILPPLFIFAGFAFQAFMRTIRPRWTYWAVILAALLPGWLGIWKMHPYEYIYYNTLVGGVGGAFRRFETDFWLTCYKELVPQLQQLHDESSEDLNLYVLRQPANAKYYLPEGFDVLRYEPDDPRIKSGDYLLLTTRANADLIHQPNAPVVLRVEKNGAVLCVVKQVP